MYDFLFLLSFRTEGSVVKNFEYVHVGATENLRFALDDNGYALDDKEKE